MPKSALGPAAPTYPIESVDNALRLLLLVDQRRSIRVSQASEALGVAVSTAHRLLAMLQYHGFVVQDPDSKAYMAGPVLVRIGLSTVQGMDLRSQARPFLQQLSKDLDETVHLIVREGQKVLFLDGFESQKAMRVVSRSGASMPAHCTSAGKALLAELSEEEVMALYPEEELPQLTPQSLGTRTALLKQLEAVRRQGFSQTREESADGVGSVGVSIHNRHGIAVGAISVAMPLSRLSRKQPAKILPQVEKAAADIANVLP
jgi:IclR family acetate operon transcriptional repressor